MSTLIKKEIAQIVERDVNMLFYRLMDSLLSSQRYPDIVKKTLCETIEKFRITDNFINALRLYGSAGGGRPFDEFLSDLENGDDRKKKDAARRFEQRTQRSIEICKRYLDSGIIPLPARMAQHPLMAPVIATWEHEHKEQQIVFPVDGKACTTSLKIAEVFGKLHKDVLKAISNMECSEKFSQRNFALSKYEVKTGKNTIKSLPMYNISKDGFAFLCMGFTGTRAAEFKEKYIDRFNEMEELLRSGKVLPPLDENSDPAENNILTVPPFINNVYFEAMFGRLIRELNEQYIYLPPEDIMTFCVEEISSAVQTDPLIRAFSCPDQFDKSAYLQSIRVEKNGREMRQDIRRSDLIQRIKTLKDDAKVSK